MPTPVFKKGNAGGPGRPKGSITKFRWDVKDICEKHGFNPFEKLIDLAMNSRSSDVQFKATAELANYLLPKLKHVEMKGDADSPFSISINLAPKKEVNVGTST